MLEGNVQGQGRLTGDWLTCLTGLRDGKGRAEPSPEGKGERENHALLGNILRGASAAWLNGKLPATPRNTKGKWKELAHTTAALWKCLPRKAWDCVKILSDVTEVWDQIKDEALTHSFSIFDVPLSAEQGQHMSLSLAGWSPVGVPPHLLASLVPRSLAGQWVLCFSLDSALLWQMSLMVPFPFHKPTAGASLPKLSEVLSEVFCAFQHAWHVLRLVRGNRAFPLCRE